MPPKRDEAALQEEEELQLAIALSQSEAEEKERMVSSTAEIFHHTFRFTTYWQKYILRTLLSQESIFKLVLNFSSST